MELQLDTIHCKDALDGLRELPNDSIDCVMTSPPYWSQRDYGIPPTTWPDGTEVVLGLEENLCSYVEHLRIIFDEVFRVLKPSGTCWVNLGDTYSGSWGNYGGTRTVAHARLAGKTSKDWIRQGVMNSSFRSPASFKQLVPKKSLCLIPERFALAMAEHGWILRNRIIWHKPNHMPASVKDRFTNSWESLFFFVKARRYAFDLDAVRVPHISKTKQCTQHLASNRRSNDPHGRRLPPRIGEECALHPVSLFLVRSYLFCRCSIVS